jgi:hypothetical protein
MEKKSHGLQCMSTGALGGRGRRQEVASKRLLTALVFSLRPAGRVYASHLLPCLPPCLTKHPPTLPSSLAPAAYPPRPTLFSRLHLMLVANIGIVPGHSCKPALPSVHHLLIWLWLFRLVPFALAAALAVSSSSSSQRSC